MIKNYFKAAWRNLIKNKVHSFINIVGLSVGIAVAIMIGLWIYDELSYDKDNPNYSQIAQVEQNVTNNGAVQTWQNVPYPLADVLRKSYGSNFKYIAMEGGASDHILMFDDKKLTELGSYFEPQAPRLLGLKMLRGSSDALVDPSSIILSASAAKAYFGNADPINKILKIDNTDIVKVAGVFQDFPTNSTFSGFNFFAAWATYLQHSWIKNTGDPWRPNAFRIFV